MIKRYLILHFVVPTLINASLRELSSFHGSTDNNTIANDDDTPPPSSSSYSQNNSRIPDESMFAPLFLVAAILLIFALLYSLLFLCVIRLGTISIREHESLLDGRIYFFDRRCYIPLLWFLYCYRRPSFWFYEEDFGNGSAGIGGRSAREQFTPEERRAAVELHMKELVVKYDDNKQENNNDSEEAEENQVCSICLMKYEAGEEIIESNVCRHKFHKECLLDWLEKSNNNSCPSCRYILVDNEQIHETAKRLKEEKEKAQAAEAEEIESNKIKYYWKLVKNRFTTSTSPAPTADQNVTNNDTMPVNTTTISNAPDIESSDLNHDTLVFEDNQLQETTTSLELAVPQSQQRKDPNDSPLVAPVEDI